MTSGGKSIIDENYLKLSKTANICLIIFLADLPLWIYSVQQSWYLSDSAFLHNLYAFAGAIGILFIISMLVFWPQKIKFKKYLINTNSYLLQWTYANGDELIISYAGIVQYIQNKPVEIATGKFDGLSWGMENVKDIVEGANNGHLSIAAFLPAIKFSGSTNKIPDYVPFNDIKQIDIVYRNLQGQQRLIMRITTKLKNKLVYTLVFQVPQYQNFTEEDYNTLVTAIAKKQKVKYGYLTE